MCSLRVVAAAVFGASQQDLLTQQGINLSDAALSLEMAWISKVQCGGACPLQPVKFCEDHKPQGRDYHFILFTCYMGSSEVL